MTQVIILLVAADKYMCLQISMGTA